MGCDISGGISHVYVEGGGGVMTRRVILEMWRDDMTGCDVLRGGVTGTGHNMNITSSQTSWGDTGGEILLHGVSFIINSPC